MNYIQKEEDLGILGPPVSQMSKGEDGIPVYPQTNCRIISDQEAAANDESSRRKETLGRMAANMAMVDEPRGDYFVREPGL